MATHTADVSMFVTALNNFANSAYWHAHYQLTAASQKDASVDNAACRGLKRRATASSASPPPYKLVPANTAPVTLPVVLYSSPIAAAGQHNAKRRHMVPSSAAFPIPLSLLTPHGSPCPLQRFLTARSLFGEPMPMGSRGSFSGTTRNIGNGQQLASYTERVAHWQREQRELLQCLLQQQVANINHPSTTAETSQVCLCLLLRSQIINEVATCASAALTLMGASICCCGMFVSAYCRCVLDLPVCNTCMWYCQDRHICPQIGYNGNLLTQVLVTQQCIICSCRQA